MLSRLYPYLLLCYFLFKVIWYREKEKYIKGYIKKHIFPTGRSKLKNKVTTRTLFSPVERGVLSERKGRRKKAGP